jgi:hypothetical protein
LPEQSSDSLDFLSSSQPNLIGGNLRTTATGGRSSERLKQQQLAILIAVVVVVGIGAAGAFVLLNGKPTSSSGTQAVTSKTQTTAPTTPTQSAEDQQVASEIGPMPVPIDSDGTIKCVRDYLLENLDDPNGLQFVKWSGVSSVAVWDESPASQEAGPKRKTGAWVIHSFGDNYALVNPGKYWGVRLKFRSKNRAGALEIQEWVFLIRGDRVVQKVRNEMSLGIYFPSGAFPGDDPVLAKKYEVGKEKIGVDPAVISAKEKLHKLEAEAQEKIDSSKTPEVPAK